MSTFSEETKNLLKGFVLETMEKFPHPKPQAILGKIVGAEPGLKGKIPLVIKEIESIITMYSKLSKEEFKKEHKKYTAHLKKGLKKQRVGLPELKESKITPYVFRFAPSPSGPLHLGHSIQLLLNSEYAKKYKGTLILRIEDTNPTNINSDAYKQIQDDAQWITKNGIAEVVIQSERLDDYYKHAETVIKQGNAYVCTCKQEDWRDCVAKKRACPCREKGVEEQERRWQSMLHDWKEGKAVVRIKTDMAHKNPAIRDWPAFRICEETHPLQGNKFRVWPLMNFSVAVDDHEFGSTHVIRGKDHEANAERQKYLYKYLEWSIPEFIHTGRVNFQGISLSSTELQENLKKGKFTGADDPRLPTLAAFRRRGLQPEAFVQYIHELGPSKVDKTVEYNDFMKAIYAWNRGVIEKDANRYFFVADPVELSITNMPDHVKADIPLHPNIPERGVRSMKKATTMFVEKSDLEDRSGLLRLMHLCTIKGEDGSFVSEEVKKEHKARAIHWLPTTEEHLVKVKVLMPDQKPLEGLGEPGLAHIDKGAIVQFERKFFVRFDHQDGDVFVFYHTHR